MKKLFISLALCLGFGVKVFATGAEPLNMTQSGVLTFSGTNLQAVTTFAPYFQSVPVMTLFGSVTNITPFTLAVTTTNFTLTITTNQTGVGVGGTVAWQAFLGTPREFYGQQYVFAATPTNVVFPSAYAVTNPSVSIQTTVTNSSAQLGGAAVTGTTSTNFTVQVPANQWVYWQSIGTSSLPIQGTAPANGLIPIGN